MSETEEEGRFQSWMRCVSELVTSYGWDDPVQLVRIEGSLVMRNASIWRDLFDQELSPTQAFTFMMCDHRIDPTLVANYYALEGGSNDGLAGVHVVP